MLNITTAKPLLIEIDRQLKDQYARCREMLLKPSQNSYKLGIDIANHIGELKELRYQLAMTPERVIYITEDYLSAAFKNARLKGI
jgi:hypothetical protein